MGTVRHVLRRDGVGGAPPPPSSSAFRQRGAAGGCGTIVVVSAPAPESRARLGLRHLGVLLVAAAIGALVFAFRSQIGDAIGSASDAIRALGLIGIPLLAAGDTLGLPATGDFIVVFWSAQRDESIVLIWLLAFAGGLIGDSAAYWIGRLGGARLVRRFLKPEREAKLAETIHRHAAPVIVFGRLIAGVRSKAAVMSGLGRFPYRRYLVYDVLGCALWATAFTVLGRLVGERALEWAKSAERYALWVIAAAVVGGAAWYIVRRRRGGPAVPVRAVEE